MVHLVNNGFVPVVPSDATQIQQTMLSELHGLALGGHLGQQKMDVLVKIQFNWLSISKDVGQFCTEYSVY